MAVITISREAGSGGTYIAEKAAQELGYHFADRSMAVAVMEEYGYSRFEEEFDSTSSFRLDLVRSGQERPELRPIIDLLPQVSLALAHHDDVVILGRGSFAVLGGFADVLNVRIQAPFGARVKWFMEQENIPKGEAEALVRERDQARSAFVTSWYGARVDEANLFDLVIDTGKVPPDSAVGWLVEMARILETREAGPGRTTEGIQIDPALASLISRQLGCDASHR
jgi:cytidylate kinase